MTDILLDSCFCFLVPAITACKKKIRRLSHIANIILQLSRTKHTTAQAKALKKSYNFRELIT
jgi:hypothetical protein